MGKGRFYDDFDGPSYADFLSRFAISDSLANDPDVEASANTYNVPGDAILSF